MKITQKLILVFLLIALLAIPIVTSGACTAPDESDTFNNLLTMMPADEYVKKGLIMINDYAAAFKDIDISLAELDEPSAIFQDLLDRIKEMEIKPSGISMASGSDIVGWGPYAVSGTITDEYVGYNFASVDAEIQAGLPPNDMTAAVGHYDAQATIDALKNQAEWPPWAVEEYSAEEYRGVTINTWGDGYEIHLDTPLRPPHIDNLGRARPLAVADGYLFSSTNLEYVKKMIDASQGKTENLSDLPEYADIVGKMSELGVFSMLLGNESFANGNPEEYASYPGPLLKNFVTFATAPGKDENGTFIALVLYHENPDDAQANVALLEERIATTEFMAKDPWSGMLSETDIQAEGNLLVARLYTDQVSLWAAWVYATDPLVLHEN